MGFLRIILSLSTCIGLMACTDVQPPAFGDPFPVSVPAGDNVLGPRLTSGPDGTTSLSWMRREEHGATLRFSTLDGDKWLPASDVVTDDKMFVNWADLPSVLSLGDGRWVSHWLSKSAAATYAYDIMLAFSDDDGRTWGAAVRPHRDDTATEHGFVSIRPDGDTAALLWLDGRETVTAAGNQPGGGMTLRAATIAPNGKLSSEQLVDDLVCDCCQTDVAVASKGPVAVYRDRSVEEIRDVYVTRFIDGAWRPGVAIADDGWEISGCPVNGPAIDAEGDLVVVAWFSAANDRPVVRAALSANSGRTFGAPLEIASTGVSGHVGVVTIDSTSAAISWVESDQHGSHAINLRAITISGELGPVATVGRSDLRRIYPQLERSNDLLILVWTDDINDTTNLASVKVPILGFYDR